MVGVGLRVERLLPHLADGLIRHDPRLSSFYHRVAERRGPQKARVATAREMLVIVWHMLTKKEPYRTRNEAMVKGKYIRMARRAREEA